MLTCFLYDNILLMPHWKTKPQRKNCLLKPQQQFIMKQALLQNTHYISCIRLAWRHLNTQSLSQSLASLSDWVWINKLVLYNVSAYFKWIKHIRWPKIELTLMSDHTVGTSNKLGLPKCNLVCLMNSLKFDSVPKIL